MSPDKTTDTQSVLDQLVKGVTDRKTPLTPIGQEATGPRYVTPAAPAKDTPPLFGAEQQAVLAQLHYIQDAATMLLSITDRLEKELTHAALGDPSLSYAKVAPVADAEKLTKAQEHERDFPAEFAAKSEAAQAATFTTTDAKASGLWVCPVHGGGVERTSKRGRKYRACEQCSEFERA